MQNIIFNAQNEVIDLENKSKANLKVVATENLLSETFILENADLLDWSTISEYQVITLQIMKVFGNKIKWVKVRNNARVSADIRLVAQYKADFAKLFNQETLTAEFMTTYKSFFEWQNVIPRRNQHTFSDELVEELKYALDPNRITSTQKNNLSEAYFIHYKDFNLDIFYKHTTENWIRNQPQNYVNWWKISEFTPLSDDFIVEFWNELNLNRLISSGRQFSEDLMRKILSKNLLKYDLKRIFDSQKFSQAFIDEFKHLLS